jgi:hypothetical protein
VEALLAFAAALVALRLAGALAARWRVRHRLELAAWSASLLAYSIASAAVAWGAAAGWDGRSFRVYYLFGGLLTAPLLGLGSLLLTGRRWALWPAVLYVGLAVGVAIATPIHRGLQGTSIPEAQAHLDFFPARLVAVIGNVVGTVAVVAVAIATIGRRPLGNGLILAGVALAAAGTALSGLGTAKTSAFAAIAAIVLYGGFTASPPRSPS